MNKTLLSLIILSLLLFSCQSDKVSEKWKRITFKPENCSFLFPSEVFYKSTDTLPSKEYGTTYMHLVNAEVKRDTLLDFYSFHHFEYPEYDLETNKEQYFKDLIQRMQTNFEATLVESNKMKHNKGDGQQFKLFIEKSQAYFNLCYYIIDGKVFGFQVVSNNKDSEDFPADEFFNSLEF